MKRQTNFQKVSEFNAVLGQGVAPSPIIPSAQRQELRMKLIHEEAIEELNEGFIEGDLVKTGDAIADALVVVYGAANDCGLDADELVAEVHRSNMSKLCDTEDDAKLAVMRYAAGNGFHGKYEPINASYRPCTQPGLLDKFVVFNADTGKTLKSPTYQEPDIASVIQRQQERAQLEKRA
ncbi:putative secreted protein [Vibrio maritimus]|uniref:Putative secreted protein n=1 Tax=Vibrio maritimus TaxID=990268 RepID=A0A090S5P0_9VIBR|nr:putative secreted protein [Vibrio maritimus]